MKFPANDEKTYPALVRALDRLHADFSKLEVSDAVRLEGVISRLENIESSLLKSDEHKKLYNWLQMHIQSINGLPLVLTHGDFNPTNILYIEENENLKVSAILDFEFCSLDPEIMDYSQLFTMAICHSGSTDVRNLTDKILHLMENRFTQEQMQTAVAAYWIDLYVRFGKTNASNEQKLALRLSQVLEFIRQT